MKAPRNEAEELVLSASRRLMSREAKPEQIASETGWEIRDGFLLPDSNVWYCQSEGHRWEIVEAPSRTAAESAYRSRVKLDDDEKVRVLRVAISTSGWIYPVK